MMKRHLHFVLAILLFIGNTLDAQSIDVESERFLGTKKLIIKSYNSCCAQKGFKAVYYFDNQGRATTSFHYFKKQLRASYEYHFNDKDLLIKKIQVFDINNKNRKDTTNYTYQFDQNDRVTEKTIHFGRWSVVEIYSDFDSLNNPQTEIRPNDKPPMITKRQYNALGQVIFKQRLEADTVTHEEQIRYNKHGQKRYSHMPTLLDKETGKMVMLLGGARHAIIEQYTYTYDRLNRWTKHYAVFENKKVLLETRKYK
jgi:hypothetical protein